MIIKIATFNIQNKYQIPNYKGIDEDGDNTHKLVSFIVENDIDILGTQEMVKGYQSRLMERLEHFKYTITGNYRLKRIGNYIPILRKYNEANSVITKYPVESTKTIPLSFLPYTPRIATMTQIMIDTIKINVINTHLEVNRKYLRQKQLNRLKKIIDNIEGYIILMGDFNMEKDNPLFQDFIKNMKNYNLKLIKTTAGTHPTMESAIDHIFVSKSLGIVTEIKVDTTLENMSDHRPVIVTLKLSKENL